MRATLPCRGGVTKRAAVKLMTEASHAAAGDATEVPPLSPAPTPVRNVACTLISVAIVVLLLQPMQSCSARSFLAGCPSTRLGAAAMLLIVVAGAATPLVHAAHQGDRTGSHRVSSGTITLNNVTIVEPSQLSAGTEFIEISIESLPILNALKAELGGTDGAKILITVTDSTARQ